MKKLYLVRHGESKFNARHIHQDGIVELSEKGIEQAKRVAQRLAEIPIEIILASPFERAKQTATIIAQQLNLPVNYNELLVEIKRPTEIEGRSVNEPEVVAIRNKIYENWHDPNFRHSDEETFFEFRTRARKVIEIVTTLENEHILVVTHGDFMSLIICLMAFGSNVEPEIYSQLRKFLQLSNTGITVCTFENNKWQLITWNDRTHLPE